MEIIRSLYATYHDEHDDYTSIIHRQLLNGIMSSTILYTLHIPCGVSKEQMKSLLFLKDSNVFSVFTMTPLVLHHHWTVTRHNIRDGRLYTLITAIFHHVSSDHLYANLNQLILLSFECGMSVGVMDTLCAFFIGGIIGSLGMLKQVDRREVAFQESFNVSPYVGESVDDLRKKYISPVTGTLFQAINDHRGIIGSSGGIYSLFGVTIAMSVHRIFHSARRYNERQTKKRFHHLLLTTGHAVLHSASAVVFLRSSMERSQQYSFASAFPKDGVAHMAHVWGFFSGIVYYICTRVKLLS